MVMRMLSGLEPSEPFLCRWSVSVEPLHPSLSYYRGSQANAVIGIMHRCDR